MDEEIHAIEKNDTWKLTNISKSKKVISLMIHFLGLEVTQKEKMIFVS
jgi:hypothetical protein